MPHKEEILLPKTWTMKSIHKRMKKEFEDRGVPQGDIITYPYFCYLWSVYLPEYKIRKVNGYRYSFLWNWGFVDVIALLFKLANQKQDDSTALTELHSINDIFVKQGNIVTKYM